MLTVYKYDFPINDTVGITMSRGARVLKVECQNGMPVLWALVDTDQPPERHTFRVFGTGHPIPDGTDLSNHVATFQHGALVWHVFSRTVPA